MDSRRTSLLRQSLPPLQFDIGSQSMNHIHWPAEYLPGLTENFASNEIIVADLSTGEIWEQLDDTRAWPTYYSNASDICFYGSKGPRLSAGARFRFTTFGFPVEAEVTEHVVPL